MTCVEKIRELHNLVSVVGECSKADVTGGRANYGREIVAIRKVLRLLLGRKPSEDEILAVQRERWSNFLSCCHCCDDKKA